MVNDTKHWNTGVENAIKQGSTRSWRWGMENRSFTNTKQNQLQNVTCIYQCRAYHQSVSMNTTTRHWLRKNKWMVWELGTWKLWNTFFLYVQDVQTSNVILHILGYDKGNNSKCIRVFTDSVCIRQHVQPFTSGIYIIYNKMYEL